MKKALILGGAGFVGRYTAKAFASAGYEVTGNGHGSWSPEDWSGWGFTRWRSCDVTLKNLIANVDLPDIIVQCAGSGAVGFSMQSPKQDFDRSVATTLAALEFARTFAPGCKVILPSSAAVYGAAGSDAISIDHPLNPISPYGVHKKMAEELCRSYAVHFGVSCAIVRLFSVYGEGLRKQLFWDVCKKLTAGTFDFDGTGEERRDWLHVEDAANLLLAASVHASIDCPTVNGGTGNSVAIREVIFELASTLGSPSRPRFSGQRRDGDPMTYEADVSESRRWGWAPQRQLKSELVNYANWYRSVSAGCRE